MSVKRADHVQAIIDFLQSNGIPERCHAMMQTIILSIVEHPEYSLKDACFLYAEAHQTSGEAVYRTFRRAVYRGWENAVMPSAMLHSQRMSPEAFVHEIITRLHI